MKLSQIDQILRVKEMRRKLAEVNYARANRHVREGETAVWNAQQDEIYIKNTSQSRREERLSKLLENTENPVMENARITNVYKITETEIENSAQITQSRKEELLEAIAIASGKREELARFLQRENKSKQLRDRLVSMEQKEAIRHE